MRLKAALVGILLAGTWGEPVSAQWVYQEVESAFGGSTHVAVTAIGQFGLGLRCNAESTEVLFMTPDKSFRAETYEFANLTNPKLLLRVDDANVVQLEAKLEDSDGDANVVAPADDGLLTSIQNAKKRIAVALELVGERYHERSFNARGSAVAVKKLKAACGIDE